MRNTYQESCDGFVRTAIASAVALMMGSTVFAANPPASSLPAVMNGNTISTEIKDVDGTVLQDGSNRVFAIFVNDLGDASNPNVVNKALTYKLKVETPTDGKGGTSRAFQNIGSTLEFTEKVTGTLIVENKKELSTASHSVYDQYDGSKIASTHFKNDVEFKAIGTTDPAEISFLSAVRMGGQGDITFSGNNSTFTAENTGYTVETLQGSSANGSFIFDGVGNVTVNAKSDYGVAGAVFANATIKNKGSFTINSELTDGYGCDLQGLDARYGTTTITNDVQNFVINLKGAAEQGGGREGVNAISARFGAIIDINAQNVSINIEGPTQPVPEGVKVETSFGIMTSQPGDTDPAGTVTIGENSTTSIVVDNKVGQSVGVSTTNNGSVSILGDVVVKATSGVENGAFAVQADSGKTTLGSADHTVKLDGNVSVGKADQTGALHIDGNSDIQGAVDIASQGTFNVGGEMKITGKVANEGQIATDGANLFVEGSGSTLGKVDAKNKSRLELGQGSYTFISINSQDNTKVVLNDLSKQSTDLGTVTGNLTRTASKAANDQCSSVEEASQKLVDAFKDVSTTDKYAVEMGTIGDGSTFEVDDAGKVINLKIYENTNLDAMGSISTLTAYQWRHDMNDLTKRMGELRMNPEGIGSWARVYGSKQTYGVQSLTSKNSSIQVGTDTDVGNGWKVGAAFTYTDGKTTYDQGSADNKGYGFATYGTWMAEDGQFVDLIAKYQRMDNEFAVASMTGQYDNNAYSLSAEYGKHLNLHEIGFVEPQVELTYGKVIGEDFSTNNGVQINQGDFESLIGRVGVRGGFYFPNNKGVIYARASVLHDFKGDMESSARFGQSSNVFDDDIGGTWVEWGLGANFKVNDQAYTYVDLERTNGGEVVEDFRWTIGARYVW